MSDPHLFDTAELSAALEGLAAEMARIRDHPTSAWPQGGGSESLGLKPEHRLSHRVLLTERLMGQGATHTAVLLVELGLQALAHFEKAPRRRDASFFQGMVQAVQILNHGLHLFRQVPDWRKSLERTYLSLKGEPEARKVFAHAVREDFEVVLPRLRQQRHTIASGAGLPLVCSALGNEITNVVTDCLVYWADRARQELPDLEAIVQGEKEVVLIATKVHPQVLQRVRDYTHLRFWALEVGVEASATKRTLTDICNLNFPKRKWGAGRAAAVSFDSDRVTILGMRDAKLAEPRRCLLSGIPEPEPAWQALDGSFRTFRHSFASGLADSEVVLQSIKFLAIKISEMPKRQTAGAQAVVAAATKLLPMIASEPISTPAMAFAVNNASEAVRDLLLSTRLTPGAVSQAAGLPIMYLASAPTETSPHVSARGGGGQGSGGGPGGPGGSGGEEEVHRFLDVLLTGEVCLNKPVVLTATVLMPKSVATGQFRSSEFIVLADSKVIFRVAFSGFLLKSASSVERQVPRDQDSEPATFIFLVQESEARWIEVSLFESESNRMLAQVTLSNFALENIEKQQIIRGADSIDLMISVDKDLLISADSPRDRENLAGVDLGRVGTLRQGWQNELDKQVTVLYKQAPDDVERELKLLGAEVAKAMPQDLRQLLAAGRVRTLLIRHTVDNAFPFELALLNGPAGEFFLADRVAVCRWIRGIPSAPTWATKNVRRAALLKGSIDLVQEEMDILQTVCCQTHGFGAPLAIRQEVFRTRSFQLLHFFGHCRYRDEPGMPQDLYLELEEGLLRLREIGALEDERVFFAEAPMVVLNACGAAAPRFSLFGEDSFPSRFLEHNASFFLGTQWPVEETVAHAFAEKFYRKLKAGASVGLAMLEAKQELVGPESNLSPEQKPWAAITLRAYTLFAHPEMRIDFESVSN